MSIGEVLELPSAAQAAYIVGVADRWSIEPKTLPCQEVMSGREILTVALRALGGASDEMRKVPAALAIELELTRACAAKTKK